MTLALFRTPPGSLTARRRSAAGLVLILFVLWLSGSVLTGHQTPVTEPVTEPITESQAPAGDDTTKETPKADLSAQLAALVASKLESIPDPRSLKRADLPRIFKILDEGIAAGRRYVAEFPESEAMPRVCCDLGRLLILNVDRHLGTLDEEAKIFGTPLSADQRLQELLTYLAEVVSYCEIALAAEISSSLRCRTQVILGDCLLKMRESSRSADAFSKALELDTSKIDLPELKIKRIEALEIAERYQEMLEAGKDCLENDPRSRFLPHLVYFTHKAHRHLGLLYDGRQLWRTWGPVLSAGALGGEIEMPGSTDKWQVPEGKERDFQLMADRAGFYEAFYQLALGNSDAALQALVKYNDQLYERINSGETISMATKTYLDFQSLPMSHRIDVLHGRVAPSLDGLRWIQAPPESDEDKKLELRLFCDSNRASNRQSRFIDLLRKLEHEYSSQGLRVVWLSSVLRAERAPREANAMTEIAIERKLGWSFGVQPGVEAGVLERHLVAHGGTLLMAIDSEGIVRWEVIDPMFWDAGLYRSIIKRLLDNS